VEACTEEAAPPLSFASCLPAGCHVASCHAITAFCPLDAPQAFQAPPPLVCLQLFSHSPLICWLVVALTPPRLVLLNPPACPPSHRQRPPPPTCSRRPGHRRRPQMHGSSEQRAIIFWQTTPTADKSNKAPPSYSTSFSSSLPSLSLMSLWWESPSLL
jgi:hypothetical protein